MLRRVLVGVTSLALLSMAATAQASERTNAAPVSIAGKLTISELASRQLTQSIGRPIDLTNAASVRNDRAPASPAQAATNERSVGRKVLGGLLGGVAGFFAGGIIGARIDGDCGGCDDPGLKGAVIGAPIGAAVGAVLGATFF